MQDEITQRVIRVIAKHQHVPVEAVEAESTFLDLGIDSLDGLQLMFELEEEFGIDIPDDAAREFASVQQASEGVSALLARKAAAALGQA